MTAYEAFARGPRVRFFASPSAGGSRLTTRSIPPIGNMRSRRTTRVFGRPQSPRGTEGSNPVPSSGESLSAVNSRAVGGKARGFAGVAYGRGREKGRDAREPGPFVAFSLTGIGAVPPQEAAGYRLAGCDCAIQLASRLCCSVQLRGRSSSVRRVAVSSTGCRPCRIVSTSCGLKKLRSIRRRM